MKKTKGKVTLYLDIDDIATLNEIAEIEDSSPSRIVRALVREHISMKKTILKKTRTVKQ